MAAANALVALQAEIQADIERFKAEMPAPSGSKVKILQSKQFQFPDGTIHGDPFKAVILDYRWVNTYYLTNFNPSVRETPPCFAIGTDPSKMVPSEASTQKQCTDCSGCLKNQFGSKGKGKACRNGLRLALAPLDADVNTQPWILTVSPTGIKPFLAYANAVRQSNKVPIQLVTTIGFNPQESYPTLLFQAGEPNPDLETSYAIKRLAQDVLDREFD